MSDINEKLIELIPEFNMIEEMELKGKCLATWKMAIEQGKWSLDQLSDIPFTLLIKNIDINFIKHTRSVTLMALEVANVFNEMYGKKLNIDHIIAGGLLHDVGKLVEITKENGDYIKSRKGKLLRHPSYGAVLAYKCGIPLEILNIIEYHSKEGEKNKRTPEAIIIHHCDFMNFEPFKD